jgi:hypothetical protein
VVAVAVAVAVSMQTFSVQISLKFCL